MISSWTDIKNPPYQWINTIQKIIKSNQLPLLDGPEIYIASDYSGQHKGSKYEVISVLFTDLKNSQSWLMNQNYMRKYVLKDGRRISFKGLNDKKKNDSLIPFLKASFQIRGVLLTVVLNKEIKNLCTDFETFSLINEYLKLEGKWNSHSFNRMLFIVNVICVLIAGLSKVNQNICWITDNDEFTANKFRINDLKLLIEKFTSGYVEHALGQLNLGTTEIDPGDRIEEDLVGIPDLAAGAISETINATAKKFGRISSKILMPYEKNLSDKTEIILDWYFAKSNYLTKELIVFEKNSHGAGYSVSKFKLITS